MRTWASCAFPRSISARATSRCSGFNLILQARPDALRPTAVAALHLTAARIIVSDAVMFRGFSFFLVFTFATAALAWAETMTFSDAAAMLAKSCATFTLDDR